MPFTAVTLEKVLSYFPENARAEIGRLLAAYPVNLKITRPRSSRLGNFRVKNERSLPDISLNGNLGNYTFLLVFLHEMAHYHVWKEFGRKVVPHGKAWKSAFRQLAEPFFASGVFPERLKTELLKFFKTTPATFANHTLLLAELAALEGRQPEATVAIVPLNAAFTLTNGKKFVKIANRRSRCKCYCPLDKKYYLVPNAAQILQTGT